MPKYNISKKNPEGSQYKWSRIGTVKIKDGQNPRISIRNSTEFQDWLKTQLHDSWLALSLFEDTRQEQPKPVPEPSEPAIDDGIPF